MKKKLVDFLIVTTFMSLQGVVFQLPAFCELPDEFGAQPQPFCRQPDTKILPEKETTDAALTTSGLKKRERFLKLDDVVDRIKITPGITILDIGAGPGFFTFKFADRLKGTGKVYATEISKEFINQLNQTINERKYQNVEAVLVTPDGVDSFYTKNTFDVVFAGELFDHLKDPGKYFKGLRMSLNVGGRLFILQSKMYSDFTGELNAEHVYRLITMLKDENCGPSLTDRMDGRLRRFVKNFDLAKRFPEKTYFASTKTGNGMNLPDLNRGRPGHSSVQEPSLQPRGDFHEENTIFSDQIDAQTVSRFTQWLNSLLDDRMLFYDMANFYIKRDHVSMGIFVHSHFGGSFQQIKWFFYKLDEAGVFSHPSLRLTEDQWLDIRRLNKIVLSSMLMVNEELFEALHIGKNDIIRTLESAGYRFVESAEFNRFYLLEFVRAE